MNRGHRIAVAGNQWITKYLVEKLSNSGYQPQLIINMDPSHAHKISGYTDLEETAKKYGAQLYRPASYGLKDEEDVLRLSAYEIDVLLVFGWQRLIPEWLINQCKYGVYGVHGGPEKPPRCRGRAVLNWAIIMNYTHFYMYLFQITPAIDAGDLVAIRKFDILPQDTILTLYHKNCIVSCQMILNNLPDILNRTVRLTAQSAAGATYLPKRTPEDGRIYWDQPAYVICNLIRAVTCPYPGAFTSIHSHIVKIYQAHLFDTKISFDGQPGEIVEQFENGDLIVCSGDYPVYLSQYEIEAGLSLKIGDIFDFERGHIEKYPVV